MKNVMRVCLAAVLLTSCTVAELNAPEEAEGLPEMRWSHMPDKEDWNAAALAALDTHGQPLLEIVPEDIDRWCPAYEDGARSTREAFWVGLMSALAKHESTYKQSAVNPNGKWFGLLQISPATARGYGCDARSGAALRDGGDNLSCALRIMAVTVPRDGVIENYDGRWRGVAADWGPMRVDTKQRDIAGWLNAQPFCEG